MYKNMSNVYMQTVQIRLKVYCFTMFCPGCLPCPLLSGWPCPADWVWAAVERWFHFQPPPALALPAFLPAAGLAPSPPRDKCGVRVCTPQSISPVWILFELASYHIIKHVSSQCLSWRNCYVSSSVYLRCVLTSCLVSCSCCSSSPTLFFKSSTLDMILFLSSSR